MNLHDRAEFERHLEHYDQAAPADKHSARHDLTMWVQHYVTRRCEAVAADTIRAAHGVPAPIKDTSGGP